MATLLSHSLWQRRFGGSRDILDRHILVDGAQARVIGVMPAAFKLPLDFSDDRPSELWQPLDLRTPDWGFWGNHSLIGVARLRDGVTPERATLTMRALEDRWIRDKVGGGWNDKDVTRRAAVPIKDLVLGDVRSALWVLFGAVGAILIIACANVANLMLAKSDGRHREIAVRTAIGASRARVVRQLLTETLLLSGIGGAAGLGLAYLGLRALLVVRPPGIPRIDAVGLDGGVLAFTMFLALATGLLFGVAPALALTRSDLNTPLKEGGWGGSGGRMGQRFRGSLAVTQMAFSVVLLIGAVLLVRSFIELRRIDLGFNPSHALTVRTTLPVAAYPADADVIRVVRTLRRRFAEFPGVQSVGATRLLPLSGTIGNWSITLEGRPTLPGENPNGDWQVVTPGYFESMGMTLVRGRFIAETDDENAPVVAVVNDTMARRYWPNDDAIGKRFRANSDRYPWITVVGVVGQVRHNAITEKPRAEMYVPHAQWGAAGGSTRRANDVRAPDRRRSAGRARPRARSGAVDRSESSARRRAPARAGHRRCSLAGAVHDAAVGTVRRAGADARHNRDLRRDLAARRPTPPGDRHPHRARRATGVDSRDGGWTRHEADRVRRGRRPGRGGGADAGRGQPALRRHALRSAHVCRRARGADDGGVGGVCDSGAARGQGEPDRRASAGMTILGSFQPTCRPVRIRDA